MCEVFVKYNPYKVETTIEIDGKPIKRSSTLNMEDRRLQEWIDDFPETLKNECNTKSFHITFQGTVLDYEDVQSVLGESKKNGFDITCDFIPAKEVKDKEKAIEGIFKEIQSGPFDELRQPDVIKAFNNAQSSDFPVNVIATMSAGKSTLINALLQQRLMPAKQEACTATITELKDRDNTVFSAEAYDQNGTLVRAIPELTLKEMELLNADPDVSTIRAEGDIPFVNSDDVSLVLVDTPGPNNSRDPEHKAATYRMLSESSKTLVLYILNATQLAVNDDNNLLNHVSESMKVGGKQSRDRFIFVVNKLDDFKKGEDSVEAAIEKVRDYLEGKGIENPNIYPASALTALNIRTTVNGIRIVGYTEEELDELDDEVTSVFSKVKKFNRNPELHLEQYAPLPPSVMEGIRNQIEEAKVLAQSDNPETKSEGMKQLALIHSGIIPIESAIRMYVLKYAKTAKIKNIVDTFSKKLESAGSFERTRQAIAENEDEKAIVRERIGALRVKLQSGENAKQFKNQLKSLSYNREINEITTKVQAAAVSNIRQQIEATTGKKWNKDEAERMFSTFQRFASNLQARVQVQLEEVVTTFIRNKALDLLEQYRKKIVDFSSELGDIKIAINPYEFVDGELPDINISMIIRSATKSERVMVGNHKEKNPERRGILGFFKLWKPSTITVNDYQNQEYIDAESAADRFFAPIIKCIMNNQKSASDYAVKEAENIKASFSEKFDELDLILSRKLEKLEEAASEEKNIDAILQQTHEHLEWLERIHESIANILEI